eukprot:jgi/Mesvir1/2005/Mv26047-RA.1
MSREARERVFLSPTSSSLRGGFANRLNAHNLSIGTPTPLAADLKNSSKRNFGNENRSTSPAFRKPAKRPGQYAEKKSVVGTHLADEAYNVVHHMRNESTKRASFEEIVDGFNKRADELKAEHFDIPVAKLFDEQRLAQLSRSWVARLIALFDDLSKSDHDRDVKIILVSTLFCGDDIEKEFSAAELERMTGVPAKTILKVRAIRKQQKMEFLTRALARKKRKLPQFVIESIAQAWTDEENSRASPQERDTIKTHERVGNRAILVGVQGAYFYLTSKEDIYLKFLAEHTYWDKKSPQYEKDVGIHVGYTTFCKYAPKTVKGKWKERNVCACETHTVMQSKVAAWTRYCKAKHGKNCKCGDECEGCLRARLPDGTCGMFESLHTTEWVKHFHCRVAEADGGSELGGGANSARNEEEEGDNNVTEDEWQGQDLDDLEINERIVEDEEGVPRVGDPSMEEGSVFRILKRACMENSCPESRCGIKDWVLCDRDKNSTELLNWFRYVKKEVVVSRPAGEDATDRRVPEKVKRPVQETMRSTPAQLRLAIIESWEDFTNHCFTSWWQSATIKDRERNMTEGDVLVHGDWAENYENNNYVQLQSQYFHKTSFVLMPMIVRYLHNGAMAKRTFFFLGEAKMKRGERALVYALRTIMETLRGLGVGVKRMFMCSDNCSSQFKSKYVVNAVFRLLMQDPDLESFEYHYLGEQHGKGEVDGQGAKFKCIVRNMQCIPENQGIVTGRQIVKYMRDSWEGGKTTSRESARARAEGVHRHFFHFPEDLDSGARMIPTRVEAIKQAHWWRLDKSDPGLLMMRRFSCYCPACLANRWEECRTEWTHIEEFNDEGQTMKTFRLMPPTQPIPPVRQLTRAELLKDQRDAIGRQMRMYDYIAVPSDREDVNHNSAHPFWVMQVVREASVLEKEEVRWVEGQNGRQKEIFLPGHAVLAVRLWKRDMHDPLHFTLDLADWPESRPADLVDCYLCISAALPLQCMVLGNQRQAYVDMSKELDAWLTALVRNQQAPEGLPPA